MAQVEMFPAVANSPATELTAAITDIATTVSVLDASKLPDAPNIATIGVDESAETIKYTSKSGNTLTGVTRGFNDTAAKAWAVGSGVARYFTAYDADAMRGNIEDIVAQKGAAGGVATLGATARLLDAQLPVNVPLQTTANITYYVRTDGNDANTGLADTADGAFKTMAKALSVVPKGVRNTVNINVADGTYPEKILPSGFDGEGALLITGNESSPSSCVFLAAGVNKCGSVSVVINGFRFNSAVDDTMSATSTAHVVYNNCIADVASSTSGIGGSAGTVRVMNSVISNKGYAAVTAAYGGKVLTYNLSGTGNGRVLFPTDGGEVSVASGTLPSGATFMTYANNGIVNPWGDNTALSRPAARGIAGNNQPISADVYTKLAFETNFDNLSNMSSGRFTVPVTGIYHVDSIVTFLSVPAGQTAQSFLYVNGVYVRRLGYKVNEFSANASTFSLAGSAALLLGPGDYVEVYARCTSAVSIAGSIDTNFEITRIA